MTLFVINEFSINGWIFQQQKLKDEVQELYLLGEGLQLKPQIEDN